MMTSEVIWIKLDGLRSVSAFNKYESTHLKALLTLANQSLLLFVLMRFPSSQKRRK